MDNRSLEDRIAAALCDVLDFPEEYHNCLLGINKKTLAVALEEPQKFSSDFETFKINNFLTNNEDGDIDLDLAEISYVASRFEH